MRKILHISKYYYPFSGGTEQIARDVVLSLKNEYIQKVIAFNDEKKDKIDNVDGIEAVSYTHLDVYKRQMYMYT